MNAKYIFVSGGVASSLGKGILAASLAKQAHSLPSYCIDNQR
jgi:CTP synthase (UTP-ammonia lyase)